MNFRESPTKFLTEVEIYWDNGAYVAVLIDREGVRRNIANGCQTKTAAMQAAREWLGKDYKRGKGK